MDKIVMGEATPDARLEELNIDAEWNDFTRRCDCCRQCALAESRQQAVVWRGAIRAPLMIIGEGPGMEEDKQGKPFVGRSGRLLDELLLAQEFGETDYHICNIVKCRPPDNRTPTEEEAKACRPLLARQFALVKPTVILLCGATAYHYFTGREDAISKARGVFIESKGCYVLPTFHPAYVLRDMKRRVELWNDLALLRQKLESLSLIRPMLKPLEGATRD